MQTEHLIWITRHSAGSNIWRNTIFCYMLVRYNFLFKVTAFDWTNLPTRHQPFKGVTLLQTIRISKLFWIWKKAEWISFPYQLNYMYLARSKSVIQKLLTILFKLRFKSFFEVWIFFCFKWGNYCQFAQSISLLVL